ncbi:MAG: sorbosone dehydrogenase family protein [Desulfatitalea sp.]|nr:PQQ-dependent sugar dehydrogenase [Desulfatitalea sp.]NNJ99173.1 sorbosone dehydrogenase family protein [Desulfatitalea sp.]
MSSIKLPVSACIAVLVLLAGLCPAATAGMKEKILLTAIRMPPGFKIELYNDAVPGARSLAMSPSGVLFVGTRNNGRVYAVMRQNGKPNGRVITIADSLNMPNGVALFDGDLYVAEVGRILRFRQIESHLDNPLPPEVVYDQFPKDTHHGWKFIRFGPEGKLYVPVGAPCNVCLRSEPVYATITRLNRDGSGFEIYAHGVRNTVGFDWHPLTGQLWFTDNGRDWLGDDQPPDELNRSGIKGLHFGFPYCHGTAIADPKFGGDVSCTRYTPPAADLGPHVAALGMRFYTGRMFPQTYRNQIFIAEHGSWNRSQKTGYRITIARLNDNQVLSYEPFAQGWLAGKSAWGRPVDVEIISDGSMLVSDDKNGVIYRISYEAPIPSTAKPPAR